MPETVIRADTPALAPARADRRGGEGLLAGTVALWAYYGTAVFNEMIVAGLAACL